MSNSFSIALYPSFDGWYVFTEDLVDGDVVKHLSVKSRHPLGSCEDRTDFGLKLLFYIGKGFPRRGIMNFVVALVPH